MSGLPAILVTGGAGYIGSHCCKALAECGYTPVCYDSLSTGHRDFVKWGPFVLGDIQDTDKLRSTLRKYNIAAVMHFAASSLVSESVANPQKYYLNNVVGSLSLLQAMQDEGCSLFVLSSTGAVYGETTNRMVSETAPCKPINPYGASKWMIEQILEDYRRAYGFGVFCLRYFNACGADVSGQIGELRDPETHLIPRIMMALQGYAPNFAIFGDDYDTRDGTAIRDYIHVTDLATAHVRAVELLRAGHSGGNFNLGAGRGYSVREVLAAVATETKCKVPMTVKPRRLGDPPMLVADIRRAQETLALETHHSDLSTIIRTAWAGHRRVHPRKV